MAPKDSQEIKLERKKSLFFTIFGLFLIPFLIFFGAFFYLAKNPKLSSEYSGGATVLVQIKNQNDQVSRDEKFNKSVSNAVYERLTNKTNLNGVQVNYEGDNKILVSKPISSVEQKFYFEKEIVQKPVLTLTNSFGQPLFYKGFFNPQPLEEFINSKNLADFAIPFEQESAKWIVSPQNNRNEIEISLKDEQSILQFADLTSYLASLSQYGLNQIYIWLNLKDFIEDATANDLANWNAANKNPVTYAFVDDQVSVKKNDSNLPNQNSPPLPKILKTSARNYLISYANVNTTLKDKKFVISGNFSAQEANELAQKINFGIANYKLSILSSSFVSEKNGLSKFKKALIAGLIVLIGIIIFMVVYYRFLGIISSVSVCLYLFLTLAFMKILGAQFSPSSIAAIILGIGISVDGNIITFERLKYEYKVSGSLAKANKKASKSSFLTILDANITNLIVALALFYFGHKAIISFSITLILSIVFTLFCVVFVTKFFSNLAVSSQFFETRKFSFGISKFYLQNKKSRLNFWNEKISYLKWAKYLKFSPTIFIFIALILVLTFGFTGSQTFWKNAINMSLEFSGGTNLIIEKASGISGLETSDLTLTKAKEIENFLINNSQLNLQPNEVKIANINNENYRILVNSSQNLASFFENSTNNLITQKFGSDLNIISYSVSTQEAKTLTFNAFIATIIALIGVFGYIIFRLKWNYAISSIIALVHDVLMVGLIFVIFRIQISPIFIIAILTVIGYSINNTIVTFDRLKENYVAYKYVSNKRFLEVEDLKKIIEEAIKNTIKRSILTTLTTMFALIVILFFPQAIDTNFSIAILVGIFFGTFSSIFIATSCWLFLEKWRLIFKKRRIDSNFWSKDNEIEEQIFRGINDFKV